MTRRHTLSQHKLILLTVLALAGVMQPGLLHAQQDATTQPADQSGTESTNPTVSSTAKGTDAAPKPPGGEGIPAVVVDGGQVMGVVGRQVRSSAGEDMGRIVDVIIDRSARVRAAVIDFGGFLGVGNRQIAVAWSAIRLPAEDKPGALVVDFTRDQLRVAPTYKAGEQAVLLGQAEAPAGGGVSDKSVPKEPPSK